MTDPFQTLRKKAIDVLHNATTPKGILALPSNEVVENYTRIWSRDSIMAGLSGMNQNDPVLIEGLRNSLNTLKDFQTTHGIIPSNVSLGAPPNVSYGGTAGRVDATLWYIIGALSYIAQTKDDAFRRAHIWHIEKAMQVTTIWEFNNKHLIYTPLSGNWADEYPIHGYTLYDNCLRLWGLELFAECTGRNESVSQKIEHIRESIKANFILSENNTNKKYHSILYERALEKGGKPYFIAGFNPSRYYTMFDCGGNGLALLLGLFERDQFENFEVYINGVFDEINCNLMPAFWPTINAKDDLFQDLSYNYAYEFKNNPHHFHNGGIWPIMNGWLAKGLARYDSFDLIHNMKSAYLDIAQKENYNFSEYISSDVIQPSGKSPLCYSAAGALMILNPNN
ncbi:MAG: glycoside hydrolase 100 family protein [Bacteroidota bacterium]